MNPIRQQTYTYFEEHYGIQRHDTLVGTVTRCFTQGKGCLVNINIEGIEPFLPVSLPEGTKILVSIRSIYKKQTFYGEEDCIILSLDSTLAA